MEAPDTSPRSRTRVVLLALGAGGIAYAGHVLARGQGAPRTLGVTLVIVVGIGLTILALMPQGAGVRGELERVITREGAVNALGLAFAAAISYALLAGPLTLPAVSPLALVVGLFAAEVAGEAVARIRRS